MCLCFVLCWLSCVFGVCISLGFWDEFLGWVFGMCFLVGFSDVCFMYWDRLGRLSGVFGVSFCCIVSALVFCLYV